MRYAAPTTINEVRELLVADADAIVFAGATDVVPQMRAGRPEPSLLIDLKHIDRLMSVSLDADTDTWHIGAAVPTATLTANPEFTADFAGLSEAAGLIGSDQIQNRSSLGGNLANASPAADSVPALVVNDAVAVIAGAGGERREPVAEVVTGPGQTSLLHDEILVCFEIARPAARTADAYLRLIPRTEMDIAVVGAGVRITLESDSPGAPVSAATVALGAVAPTVVSVPAAAAALVGSSLDDESLAAAAAAASDAANPIDDKRGTIAYRRHVAGVLTKRAARIAADRAAGRASGRDAGQAAGRTDGGADAPGASR